jgi:hypothetical protein
LTAAFNLPARLDLLQDVHNKEAVTLKVLLDAGLIHPGEGNVACTAHGVTHTANLLPSGLIEFQG